MSFPVNIQGQIIQMPSTAQSPVWSEAIIEFVQAVEQALNSVVGPFDIPPQIYTMVSNANTNVSLPNLIFPPSNVLGAIIAYSFKRSTNTESSYEVGELQIVYNVNGSSGQKWEISRTFTGQSPVGKEPTFTISDVGQILFSSTALSGTGFTGQITYSAKAILVV